MNSRNWQNTCLQVLLDLVYPLICIQCRQPIPKLYRSLQLCFHCRHQISHNVPPFCALCSRHLITTDTSLCPECHKQNYHFDRVFGACFYDKALRSLLHHFKYGQKTVLRRIFAHKIITFINTYHLFSDLKASCLIPVPLHNTRLKERGYNQSELIAIILAKHLKIPILTDCVIRTRYTKNQAVVTKKERWTNTTGAFKIKHSYRLKDINILLFDDLYTTGATTSEIARILKLAGANQVTVLTLAIASKENRKDFESGREFRT